MSPFRFKSAISSYHAVNLSKRKLFELEGSHHMDLRLWPGKARWKDHFRSHVRPLDSGISVNKYCHRQLEAAGSRHFAELEESIAAASRWAAPSVRKIRMDLLRSPSIRGPRIASLASKSALRLRSSLERRQRK